MDRYDKYPEYRWIKGTLEDVDEFLKSTWRDIYWWGELETSREILAYNSRTVMKRIEKQQVAKK